jgi:DNA-binding IscR family transcriptional regulator
MRRDSRLSVVLHLLLHMTEFEGPATSEALGPLLNMNPVLVRRVLGGLRNAGIVSAEKGHGGGWALARPLDRVTLAEVYRALGSPSVLGICPQRENPRCLVEQAVNRSLGKALGDAEALLLTELERTTVAAIARDVTRHHPHSKHKRGNVHA